MKIEILFCNPINKFLNFFSGIIRWGQNTNYSHMAIYFPEIIIKKNEEFKHIVMDATLNENVSIHTIQEFKKKYIIVKKKEIYIEKSQQEIKSFMITHINKSYSWPSIIGFGFKYLGIMKKNPFGNNEKKLICSELIILFLEFVGLYTIDKDIDSCDLMTVDNLLNKI